MKTHLLTGPTHRLGTFYNATPGAHNKDQVEQWASKAYPDIWADLLKLGKTTVVEGDAMGDPDDEDDDEEEKEEEQRLMREEMLLNSVEVFNIDRSVEA